MGEGAAGRRRRCLAAILGRVLGVVTVDVVVDVPAPARRRAGAMVVGRVLVDVTGRGRLVDGVGTVVVAVTGRVLVVFWCSGGDWWCRGRGGRGGAHACHRR